MAGVIQIMAGRLKNAMPRYANASRFKWRDTPPAAHTRGISLGFLKLPGERRVW